MSEEKTLSEWKRILEPEFEDVKGFRKLIVDFKNNGLKLYFTVLTPSRKEEVYKIFEQQGADDVQFSFSELK